MSDEAAIRRENFKRLAKTPSGAAATLGGHYSYWAALMNDPKKSFGEKVARRIEDAYEKPRGFLDQPAVSELPASYVPTASGQDSHSVAELAAEYRVSKLGVHAFEHACLSIEQVKTMETLPERFVLVLPDDAMGKHGRAGTEVLFQRANDAKPGAGVLVADSDGKLYVRRKAQGREDSHWLAIAPNPVYRELDSELHGLQLLAVWRGVVNVGLEDQA